MRPPLDQWRIGRRELLPLRHAASQPQSGRLCNQLVPPCEQRRLQCRDQPYLSRLDRRRTCPKPNLLVLWPQPRRLFLRLCRFQGMAPKNGILHAV